MTTIASILRDGEDPSMPALRSWLQNLGGSVSAAAQGFRTFQNLADLNAYAPAAGAPTYAFVVGDRFVAYKFVDGAWQADPSYAEGVANVVQPLVTRAEGAAIVTMLLSALILDHIPAVPIDGDPNNIRVDVDNINNGQPFDFLVVKTNTRAQVNLFGRATNGGDFTQRLVNGGGQDIGVGTLEKGKVVTVQYSAAGGALVVTAIEDMPAAPGSAAADPLAPLRAALIDNPYAPTDVDVLSVGSSIGVGYGASAGDAPVDYLASRMNAKKRQAGPTYHADNQCVIGQSILDFGAQANASTSTRPRRIKVYVPLMNDGYFRRYVMLHTFPLMQEAMKRYLEEDGQAGILSVVLGSPHPNFRTVDLASELPNDVAMSWPVYKAAPVSAADIRAVIGSDLTDELDWTGSGKLTRGVRTFAHLNAWLRDLCRTTPTALFGDVDWSFRRYGLEPAVQMNDGGAAVDALYVANQQNHFSHAGYTVGYHRVLDRIANAIVSGDLGSRYFRGDEA